LDAKTVEARALGLFACADGELTPLCHKWDIKVPQLLHHDSDAHIIIMEDLGRLDSLTAQLKYMTPLRGNIHEEQEAYKELGTRLGGFMAELHSPSTLERLGHKRGKYFDNPSIRGVIYDNMVVPIRRRLADFGISDAEVLYERIAQDHLRPLEFWEQNFMLGDLWTGSVLLDWPRLCVIDWEFASIGRSVNGDMATLSAQFHLHLLEAPNGSSTEAALKSLIQSTVKEYRRQLRRPECVTKRVKDFSLRDNPATDFPAALLSAIRSAFITHGRKMINNAVERDWRCDCCNRRPKTKTDCLLIRKMVERGVWYVRTAASNRTEFAKDTNWKEVRKEEGKVILGLFMDC
jgi:tRNA A-37 threonylcarbamoyl transferase component Bud32